MRRTAVVSGLMIAVSLVVCGNSGGPIDPHLQIAAAPEGLCPSAPFDINYIKGRGLSLASGYHCFDTTASEAFAEDPDQIVLVLSGKGHKIYVGVRRTGTGQPELAARRALLKFYKLSEDRVTIERIFYGQYDGFVLITPRADAALVDEIMSGFVVSGSAALSWQPFPG